jgi:hypothetical protein
MQLVLDWAQDIIRLFLGRIKYPIPTDSEISNLIDQRLGDDNGRDDGRIIRIKTSVYDYYITRSPREKRRR